MEKFLNNFPIQLIDFKSPAYPKLLKQILDPPAALYFRGNLTNNEKCFAVVGTRLASDYGKEIAYAIAKDLARAGLTIVSGMAFGIDAFAHQGALEAATPRGLPDSNPLGVAICPTIAVLGNGLDEPSIYPQANLKLAKKILEQGGALISEYPVGTKAAKFTFPQRNRIITGMSSGVLVVEAKFKSGALITASFAKHQKKKIFAVPGSIHSRNSQGCHLLIKQGAKLVENANDILRDLGLSPLFSNQQSVNSPEEKLILDVLAQGGLAIDKIIEMTKLSAQLVSVHLSMMEIENRVKNLGGNVYAINR